MDSDAFADKLQRSISKRKQELARIKFSIDGTGQGSGNLGWQIRAAAVISYSHWEGFVKDSSKAYIEFINSQGLQTRLLHYGLQAACCSSHMRQVGASRKLSFLGERLADMDTKRSEVFSVNPNKIVETESNLSSTVFRELIDRLGLSYLGIYDTRIQFIDEKLVHGKNQVAHGELVEFEFDPETAYERIDGTLLLLNTYSDQLLDAVQFKRYLLPSENPKTKGSLF